MLGLAIDLFTKYYAFEHLMVQMYQRPDDGRYVVVSRQPDPAIIPGFLQFHVTVNQGAVFGIAQGYRWLFLVVSIGAIGLLTALFLTSQRQPLYQVLLGILLAGVLGNMYDRLAYGYVRDMILIFADWGIFPWIFNVADALLCVGVALLLLHGLFARKPQPAQPSPAP